MSWGFFVALALALAPALSLFVVGGTRAAQRTVEQQMRFMNWLVYTQIVGFVVFGGYISFVYGAWVFGLIFFGLAVVLACVKLGYIGVLGYAGHDTERIYYRTPMAEIRSTGYRDITRIVIKSNQFAKIYMEKNQSMQTLSSSPHRTIFWI